MPRDRYKPPLWVRIREFPGRLAVRISDFGGAVMATIERPFAWMGRRMLAASEKFEGIDSIFVRLGRILVWPFLAVWRLLAYMFDAILPDSVRNVLLAPFRFVGWATHAAGHALWVAAEKLNLDVPVRWLVWLLQPLWRPFAALGGFIIAWLTTRRFRQLLWGLPAILLAGPLIVAGSWRWALGASSVAGQYRLASKQAVEEEDFKAAQFYDRKLSDLGDDTKTSDYRRAVALAEQGKVDAAYKIMSRISPLEAPTFPASHAWIVQQLFGGGLKIDPKEAHELAGKHLDALDKLKIKSPNLDLLRALWLEGEGKPKEALAAFKPLVLNFPEAALARMQIHINLKDLQGAREDAAALRDHIEKLKTGTTSLNAEHYRWMAMAQEVLGNDDELSLALQGWLKMDPQNEQAKTALAEVYRRQYEKLIRAASPPIDRLAQLLSDAARHPTSRVWAEGQIALLMRSRKAIPTAKALVDRLEGDDKTPPVLIEEMGTWLALQNDAPGARRLLGRSLAKDPSNAIAWNNYAWALGEGAEPELDKALDAVEKALALSPGEYRFRETRGQILAKQEKWQPAVDDLEAALNAMPETPGIHATLAKAYDALGQKDLAEVHRQQSQ